jgi:cytochrome b involved in lipid metabolism
MPPKTSKKFSVEDVRQHRSVEDMYIIVHDKVYDVTKFIDEHP